MSIMATTATGEMKSSTKTANEFLTGDGVDLTGQQKRLAPDGGATGSATDQDDLDLFLSEITVQFDDEVQTLYVGPVEIVDDDDDDDGGGDRSSALADTIPAMVQTKEEIIDVPVEQTTSTSDLAIRCQQIDDPTKHDDDITVDIPAVESQTSTASPPTAADASSSNHPPEKESSSQQAETFLPPSPTIEMATCLLPTQPPTAEEGDDGGNEASDKGEDGEQCEAVEEDDNDTSANDDRLHRLTAAGVVIDPKNGEAEQPVSCEELNSEPEPVAEKPSLSSSLQTTELTESKTDQRESTEQEENVELNSTEPEPLEFAEQVSRESSTSEFPKSDSNQEPPSVASLEKDTIESTELPATAILVEESLVSEPSVSVTPPDSSNEGSAELVSAETIVSVSSAVEVESPHRTETKTPEVTAASLPAEDIPLTTESNESEHSQPESIQEVQPLPTIETQPIAPRSSPRRSLRKSIKEEIKQLSPVLSAPISEKRSLVKKLEIEPQDEEPEIEAEVQNSSAEGELIVPDVLVPQRYDKDSSPASSDSGIENEPTDLNKTVSFEEGEQFELTETDKTVENIPRENNVGTTDVGQRGKLEENKNTQVDVLEKTVIQKTQIKSIQCAKCAMCFKKELWYKKHLMNYHGIDLSNIAHFLSNLQTLDEGIQDGDGTTEQEFEEFQLESGITEDGDNNDTTDKTEEQAASGKRNSEECTVKPVKRLRAQNATSTPSPTTMQMYPEVKLSTNKTKPKAPRRRKEKLVLINSDADMRIKHEYAPVATHSEESTSAPTSACQPLMNNMFVVRYLEHAAMMVGSGESMETSTLNKENGRLNNSNDPLLYDELDNSMTPFERSKIAQINEENKIIFSCSICEAVFEDRRVVQDHVNTTHSDVKRRSCAHCGRTFNQTGDLTRHVRIHTGIRPFKCPLEGCTYAFISSGDLHKHVRRHNQKNIPKPHVCSVCGKDFERGYDLKRHSSMHAKDDPNFQGFSCELCGKVFARKDQYRAHTYRHIGYKPHKCTQCDKTFSDASNYAKHIKVHAMDGVQLFCHHCEKGFKNKMAISKHVLRCKYKGTTRKKSTPRKKKTANVKKEKQEPEPTTVLGN